MPIDKKEILGGTFEEWLEHDLEQRTKEAFQEAVKKWRKIFDSDMEEIDERRIERGKDEN